MRRQSFVWTIIVAASVFAVYGGFMMFYNINHGKSPSVLSIVFFSIGLTLFVLFFVLYTISFFQMKKKQKDETVVVEDIKKEELKEVEPEEKKEKPAPTKVETHKADDVEYVRTPRTYETTPKERVSYSTVYVRKVGYGPVLRVCGEQILDMRDNTYYRIQGSSVFEEGRGQAYEISGNRIRKAFGGYLYEISGSNINKIYGGFFASISGSYITTYELDEKYELSDSLTRTQLLAVVALIFGDY